MTETSSNHKKPHIQAVLFDLDGTIIDTTELVYQAYEYTLAKHNHSLLPRPELLKKMGKPLHETYQELTSLHQVEDLFITHDEWQVKKIHLAVPFYNLQHVLETLKQNNIKMAVVTSRGRQSTELILNLNKLISYFDTIVTFDDVEDHKPSPEGIQKVLKELNVSAEHAIMIGDTDADVLAGKNADVATIGVTYGTWSEHIKELKPDYTIDAINDVLPIIL